MREKLSELVSRRMKEMRIGPSDLARLVGKTRGYIGNMANGTAPTKSGEYEPSPEVVSSLAKALEVDEQEILEAMDYLPENGKKSTTIEINSGVSLTLHKKDISPEDRDEYDRAVSIAVEMAERRIKERHVI